MRLGWGYSLAVECLPSIHEFLGSTSSTGVTLGGLGRTWGWFSFSELYSLEVWKNWSIKGWILHCWGCSSIGIMRNMLTCPNLKGLKGTSFSKKWGFILIMVLRDQVLGGQGHTDWVQPLECKIPPQVSCCWVLWAAQYHVALALLLPLVGVLPLFSCGGEVPLECLPFGRYTVYLTYAPSHLQCIKGLWIFTLRG